MRSRKSFVLVTVLWILFILSVLAVGLSWVGSGEVSLLRLSVGHLRAYAAARGGLSYAENLLIRRPSNADILGLVGAAPRPGEKDLAFTHVAMTEDQSFDIGFPAKLFVESKDSQGLAGIADEAGRLNINSVSSYNGAAGYALAWLVERFSPGMGTAVRDALLAFRLVSGADAPARVFFFPQEMLLLDGMTPELFEQLRPYITVYPLRPEGLRVNVYSAPSLVVRAVFQGMASQNGFQMDTARDADNFLRCREDAFLRKQTPVVSCGLPGYMGGQSFGPFHAGIYRIRSVGVDADSGVKVAVEEVVQAANGSLNRLSWYKE